MSIGSRLKSTLDFTSTLAILATCGLIWWRVGTPVVSEAGGTRTQDVEAASGESSLTSFAQGSATAPLALLAFTDFECPFCARFAHDVYPKLLQTYVSQGRLRYDLRHYPLESIHTDAVAAGTALECAGTRGRYWQMHDLLFGRPTELSHPQLLAHASSLGLSRDMFEQCLQSAPERIKTDQREAARLGVNSTPTFFLGQLRDGHVVLRQRINGAATYAVFSAAIEDALRDASSASLAHTGGVR